MLRCFHLNYKLSMTKRCFFEQLHIEPGYRFLFSDVIDHFSKETGDGKGFEVLGNVSDGERIGADNFREIRFSEPFDSGARKNRVSGGKVDFWLSTGFEQGGFGIANRASGVDNVVDDDWGFAFDVSDNVTDFGFVMFGTTFVQDDERDIEAVCKLFSFFGATGVGGDDDGVFDVFCGKIINHQATRVEVINGAVKKSLDLVRVEMDGDDVVSASFDEEIGHEFGGDAFAWFVDFVLARVGVVGNDEMDFFRETLFRCVDHEKKFHEVVVHFAGTAGLNKEYFLAAKTFVEFNVGFPAGKLFDGIFSKGDF